MRTTIYVVLIWKKNGKDHSVINHVCLLLGEEEKKSIIYQISLSVN